MYKTKAFSFKTIKRCKTKLNNAFEKEMGGGENKY